MIPQLLRFWEREAYSDLQYAAAEGTACWFCAKSAGGQAYAETTVNMDGTTIWIPICDNCDPLPPSHMHQRQQQWQDDVPARHAAKHLRLPAATVRRTSPAGGQ